MAFRITQKPTFKARAYVEMPNSKGGFDSSNFLVEFKHITTEQHTQYVKDSPLEFLPPLIVGWDELIDDDNQQVPFNETNLQMVMAIPNAVIGIKNAFWGAVSKAKEKN